MKRYNDYKVLSASRKDYFIYVTDELLSKIQKIVSLAPQEAQWFHFVDRRETEKCVIYEIRELLIPVQECSASEVESVEKHMNALAEEIEKTYGEDKFVELYNTMTAWCHSHVEMAPTPSTTDQKTFESFKDGFAQNPAAQEQPIIMMIFNKRGEYYNKVWDPVTNLLHENVYLYIEPRYDHEDLEKLVKERMKPKEYSAPKTFPPPAPSTQSTHSTPKTSTSTSTGESPISSFLKRSRFSGDQVNKLFEKLEKMSLKEAEGNQDWKASLKTALRTSTMSTRAVLIGLYFFLLSCSGTYKEDSEEVVYLKFIITDLASYKISPKEDTAWSAIEVILDELPVLLTDADIISAAMGRAAIIGWGRNMDLTDDLKNFLAIKDGNNHFCTEFDDRLIKRLQNLIPVSTTSLMTAAELYGYEG